MSGKNVVFSIVLHFNAKLKKVVFQISNFWVSKNAFEFELEVFRSLFQAILGEFF